MPARCGSLTVYEDRAAGDGRTIDLKIVVIPAVSDNPEPDPLFFLAGGPGQAATELAGPMLPLLADVRRNRDLVFVDQRGTGGSGRMTCAFFENEVDEQALGESLQVDTLDLDELRGCLAEVEAVADPRQYTTPVAMDDLDDVRAALGYDTINLYGGSYGTRAGLVYMRRHPERVRTAVLDGLAPVSIALPSTVNADAHRALDLLFADCAADAACDAAFPDLRQTFARVIAELEASPRRLDTIHPRTGEPFESDADGGELRRRPPRRALQPDLREPGAVHRRARRRGRLRPVPGPDVHPDGHRRDPRPGHVLLGRLCRGRAAARRRRRRAAGRGRDSRPPHDRAHGRRLHGLAGRRPAGRLLRAGALGRAHPAAVGRPRSGDAAALGRGGAGAV